MENKILPCKCGGKARLFRNGIYDWYIECGKCNAKVEGDTREDVTDKWNEVQKNE